MLLLAGRQTLATSVLLGPSTLNAFCWFLFSLKVCGRRNKSSSKMYTLRRLSNFLDTDETGCEQMSLAWVSPSPTPAHKPVSVSAHTYTHRETRFFRKAIHLTRFLKIQPPRCELDKCQPCDDIKTPHQRQTPWRKGNASLNSLKRAILVQAVLKLFPNASQEVPSFCVLHCPANPDPPWQEPGL